MRRDSVEPARGQVNERSPLRPSDAAEILIRTCPVCGKELQERKCKLFCPDPCCGYFLSCADYY